MRHHLLLSGCAAAALAGLVAPASGGTVDVFLSPNGNQAGSVSRVGPTLEVVSDQGTQVVVLEATGREASTLTVNEGSFAIDSLIERREVTSTVAADQVPPAVGTTGGPAGESAVFELGLDADHSFSFSHQVDISGLDIGEGNFRIERVGADGAVTGFFDQAAFVQQGIPQTQLSLEGSVVRSSFGNQVGPDGVDAFVAGSSAFESVDASGTSVSATGVLTAGRYRFTHDVDLAPDPNADVEQIATTLSFAATQLGGGGASGGGDPTVIPTPSAVLAGLGLAGMALVQRRRPARRPV